jgi:hypothetical protein
MTKFLKKIRGYMFASKCRPFSSIIYSYFFNSHFTTLSPKSTGLFSRTIVSIRSSCILWRSEIKTSKILQRKSAQSHYQSLSPVFIIIETVDLSPVFSSIETMDFFLLCSFHFQSYFFDFIK